MKVKKKLSKKKRVTATVTLKAIKALNPCTHRFENYIHHYEDKSFTKRRFLNLKYITQEDKVWVAFRLMTKLNVKKAAVEIAESVLHIYESAYPNDNRPRAAISAAKAVTKKDTPPPPTPPPTPPT